MAGAHRTIRTLSDGEGPYTGELVTRRHGVAVRVRAEDLQGWPGWAFAGAEHVAAPLDVALRPDGQDVLLPWCASTVLAHLAQSAGEGPLPHGEAVTLAVSVLRGLLELDGGSGGADDTDAGQPPDGARGRGAVDRRAADVPACGAWWLTDDARPLFAIAPVSAPGGGIPTAESAEVLRALEGRVEDRALRRVLNRLIDALEEPRRLRAESARWERELLEIAAPRPLRLSAGDAPDPAAGAVLQGLPALRRADGRPPRRRDLRRGAAPVRRRGRGVRADRSVVVRRRAGIGARGLLARAADRAGRGMGDGVARLAAMRGRPRGRADPRTAGRDERPAARRRWAGPATVAAAAAAVIAVAGALWPGEPGTADAADHTTSATSSPMPGPTTPGPTTPVASAQAATAGGSGTPRAEGDRATDGPTLRASAPPRRPGASGQKDPRAAAEELIAAASSCRTLAESACAEVWDGGSPAARILREGSGAPVLIEDYGDVAAIRNGSGDGAQMVVIIRRDAEWRIREVYDIADPPSEGTGAP